MMRVNFFSESDFSTKHGVLENVSTFYLSTKLLLSAYVVIPGLVNYLLSTNHGFAWFYNLSKEHISF